MFSLFILVSVTLAASTFPPMPENDGHFFYVDMSKGAYNKEKDSS